jgi:hypothetical protein
MDPGETRDERKLKEDEEGAAGHFKTAKLAHDIWAHSTTPRCATTFLF